MPSSEVYSISLDSLSYFRTDSGDVLVPLLNASRDARGTSQVVFKLEERLKQLEERLKDHEGHEQRSVRSLVGDVQEYVEARFASVQSSVQSQIGNVQSQFASRVTALHVELGMSWVLLLILFLCVAGLYFLWSRGHTSPSEEAK